MGKYDSILHLPHHQSDTRPHIPSEARAAQFAPFAALSGMEDAMREAERRNLQRLERETVADPEMFCPSR